MIIRLSFITLDIVSRFRGRLLKYKCRSVSLINVTYNNWSLLAACRTALAGYIIFAKIFMYWYCVTWVTGLVLQVVPTRGIFCSAILTRWHCTFVLNIICTILSSHGLVYSVSPRSRISCNVTIITIVISCCVVIQPVPYELGLIVITWFKHWLKMKRKKKGNEPRQYVTGLVLDFVSHF